jgi:hypothetical protein
MLHLDTVSMRACAVPLHLTEYFYEDPLLLEILINFFGAERGGYH